MEDSGDYGAIIPSGGRGCGKRKQGGIYAECGLSSHGLPLEFFLCDPPVRVDEKDLGLSDIGVKLMFFPNPEMTPCQDCRGQGTQMYEHGETNAKIEEVVVAPGICESCDGTGFTGTWHILDIVGQEFYPNVADFVEEMRRYGMSRRCELPTAEDYAKISHESRVILLHRRAWVGNAHAYYDQWQKVYPMDGVHTYEPCPTDNKEHALEPQIHYPEGVCAGIWWNDVEHGEKNGDRLDLPFEPTSDRYVIRTMPSFVYGAVCPPEGLTVEQRQYELAIFAKIPVTRLVVVNGDSKTVETKFNRAKAATVPVDVVEE